MSILAMTWAWGLMELDQSQTLVLLALADAANDEGVCWPSQAEIGRKARLKDRAVRNQIRSLEAAGLLSVSRRATPQGRKTNVYRLNIGCDFSLQSKQPARNAGWVEGSESEPVDNRTFRCNQSNRHEMPVGDPTGTVIPVATGTVMPVASIHQTPNIQTPNLTPHPLRLKVRFGWATAAPIKWLSRGRLRRRWRRQRPQKVVGALRSPLGALRGQKAIRVLKVPLKLI